MLLFGKEFDYKSWASGLKMSLDSRHRGKVKDCALPVVHALRTVRKLREVLKGRGGWTQLEKDMEKGSEAMIFIDF